MKKERNRKPRTKNVGNLDAIIRVTLGSILLVAGIAFENWWGLIGLVFIVTGALSWCPFYKVLGIKTCEPNLELEV